MQPAPDLDAPAGVNGIALTAQDGYFGMSSFPIPRVFGSALLGLLLVAGAVVLSVRLGRRSDGLALRRRQVIVVANVAAGAGVTAGGGVVAATALASVAGAAGALAVTLLVLWE